MLAIQHQGIMWAQTIPVPPQIKKQQPDLEQQFPNINSIDPLTLPGGSDQFLFDLPEQILLRTIRFSGNTIIDGETIRAAIAGYEGKNISKNNLNQIEETINALYQNAGYEASRAFVSPKSTFEDEKLDLHLQIIEVKLEQIEVFGAGSLTRYVDRQFSTLKGKPLDSDQLLNEIRFLLLDERIDTVNATVNTTPRLEQRKLFVEIDPAKLWSITSLINNGRSPSVGTFERGINVQHLNLIGFGDTLNLDYRNTDGSNIVAVGYDLPLTATRGTLELDYLWGQSQIIGDPFQEFDIESRTQSFGLGFNQPVLRQSNEKQIQKLELGLKLNRTENSDQILGQPFPITEGADINGKIRSTRLDFSQRFLNKTLTSTLFIDSTFGFGLGLGNTNDSAFGDGSFIKWTGQGLFSKNLTPKLLSISSANLQVANRDVIGNEQFTLGGRNNVRGFLTSQFSRTNGLNLSQEFRYQVYGNNEHKLEITGFLDFGTGWNDKPQINESNETLASVGMGLTYRLKGLRAALEYGIPFVGNKQPNNSLQGNGVLLNLQFTF